MVAIPYLIMNRQWMSKLSKSEWILLFLIAWGSSGLATWLFTEAFRHGNPSVVILLQKFQPLFAIIAARLLLSENLRKQYPYWLIIALVGAYFLSFGWNIPFGAASKEQWIGSLLALGAALLWGGGTAFGRKLLGKMSFVELTSARFALAVPFLFSLQLFKSGSLWDVPTMSANQWGYLLLLSLFPGLLGILFYYRGLRDSKASYATIAELTFPASALLLNWWILDRGITLTQGCGIVIIFICVLALTMDRDPIRLTTNQRRTEGVRI